MIAIIRIKGQVKVRKDVKETLDRLRIRRKYACVVIKRTEENMGMVNKVKDFVAYGQINPEVFVELVNKRGQTTNKAKKIDLKKAAEEIFKGKSYDSEGIKPFFRLHPPRGGIDSKKHFGVDKGVLGDNQDKINGLIRRML